MPAARKIRSASNSVPSTLNRRGPTKRASVWKKSTPSALLTVR